MKGLRSQIGAEHWRTVLRLEIVHFTHEEILHFSFLSEKPTKAPIDNSRRGESNILFGILIFFLNNCWLVVEILWHPLSRTPKKHPEHEAPLQFALPLFLLGKSWCCWCRFWWCCRDGSTKIPLHPTHLCSSQPLQSPLSLAFYSFQKTTCSVNEAASFQLWQQSPGRQNSQRSAGGKVPMEQLWEPKVSCALKTSFLGLDSKCGRLNIENSPWKKKPTKKNFLQVFSRIK